MRRSGWVVALYLILATAIAVASFFSIMIVGSVYRLLGTLFLFLPLLLGGVYIVCSRAAFRKAGGKLKERLVFCYSVVLSPFAFCYPGWYLFFFLVAMTSGPDHIRAASNGHV